LTPAAGTQILWRVLAYSLDACMIWLLCFFFALRKEIDLSDLMSGCNRSLRCYESSNDWLVAFLGFGGAAIGRASG
jgi:hypothetical protein